MPNVACSEVYNFDKWNAPETEERTIEAIATRK